MYKQFTTSVIVFRSLKADTDVLMIHHKKFNKWMIPGGHIENTENPNEAAVREVFEESGVHIKLISFIHRELLASDGQWLLAPEYLYQQIIPASSKEGQHFHLDLTYVGYALSDVLVLNEAETNGAQWVPVGELPGINTFDGTRVTIMDVYNRMLASNEKLNHEHN